MRTTFLALLLSFLLFAGCLGQETEISMDKTDSMQAMDDSQGTGDTMANATQPGNGGNGNKTMANGYGEGGQNVSEDGNVYSGKVLAGSITKYIRYNKADYDLARSQKKVVFLYFLANWCPICRADRPGILEAFEGLDDPDAVGFEVHYNDDETNSEDEAAAKQFNVVYQHTAIVIAPDGSESYRSLSGIDRDTIISEIAKAG